MPSSTQSADEMLWCRVAHNPHIQSKFLALAGRGEGGGGVLVSLCFLYLLSPRTRLFAMPRHAASRTGSEVDALRVQTVAAALDPFLDDADLP